MNPEIDFTPQPLATPRASLRVLVRSCYLRAVKPMVLKWLHVRLQAKGREINWIQHRILRLTRLCEYERARQLVHVWHVLCDEHRAAIECRRWWQQQ